MGTILIVTQKYELLPIFVMFMYVFVFFFLFFTRLMIFLIDLLL